MVSIAILLQNEWVICRVFQKSSGGKKIPFTGLMRLNSVGNELGAVLPPLTDSSPYSLKSESVHVSCFSNPMNIHENRNQDFLFDQVSNPLFASTSNSPGILTRNSLPYPFYSSQGTPSYQTGLSTENSSGLSNLVMRRRSFEEQGAPSTSFGPNDLEYIWNYWDSWKKKF